MVRAGNGDLVAAHRTDMPEKFVERDPETGQVLRALDLYEGLGVSISRDEGRTWSTVKKLYDWGRHHFGMVVLPNGDIDYLREQVRVLVEQYEATISLGIPKIACVK